MNSNTTSIIQIITQFESQIYLSLSIIFFCPKISFSYPMDEIDFYLNQWSILILETLPSPSHTPPLLTRHSLSFSHSLLPPIPYKPFFTLFSLISLPLIVSPSLYNSSTLSLSSPVAAPKITPPKYWFLRSCLRLCTTLFQSLLLEACGQTVNPVSRADKWGNEWSVLVAEDEGVQTHHGLCFLIFFLSFSFSFSCLFVEKSKMILDFFANFFP